MNMKKKFGGKIGLFSLSKIIIEELNALKKRIKLYGDVAEYAEFTFTKDMSNNGYMNNYKYINVNIGKSILKHFDSVNTNIADNRIVEKNNQLYVLLKKGLTYKVEAHIVARCESLTGHYYCIADSDGNIYGNLSFTMQGKESLNVDYSDNCTTFITPKEDLLITCIIYNNGDTDIDPITTVDLLRNYCIFQIHQIGINIDPLAHVNKETGIEDTPVGSILHYMGTKAPAHYLVCDGQEYDIVDYPYLVKHIEDEFNDVNYWGGDKNKGTFAVPDLRGEFLRGTGTATRSTGGGAAVGIHQDATKHPGMFGNNAINWQKNSNIVDVDRQIGSNELIWINGTNNSEGSSVQNYTSRPTNTAVLYCIKYEPTYFIVVNKYGSSQDDESSNTGDGDNDKEDPDHKDDCPDNIEECMDEMSVEDVQKIWQDNKEGNHDLVVESDEECCDNVQHMTSEDVQKIWADNRAGNHEISDEYDVSCEKLDQMTAEEVQEIITEYKSSKTK